MPRAEMTKIRHLTTLMTIRPNLMNEHALTVPALLEERSGCNRSYAKSATGSGCFSR